MIFTTERFLCPWLIAHFSVLQDRYELCYKTIQAYLDSFSTCSNFADC